MSVLLTVGMGLLRAIAGASYGPEITGEVLRTTAADYARSAGLGFLSTPIAAGYARWPGCSRARFWAACWSLTG